MPNSAEIRKSILEKRQRVSDTDRDLCSATTIRRTIDEFAKKSFQLKHKEVALYRSMASEIALEELDSHWRHEGVLLSYPQIVDREGGEMRFVRPKKGASKWVRSSLGFDEMVNSDLVEVQPSSISLIVVPGVAFDLSGNRIGMGKGFYDRFLVRTEALRVSLVYDFQVLVSINTEAWDQKVDWILTDQRSIPLAGLSKKVASLCT